ncbi:cobalamin biosynthesis protein [Acetobacter ascendens]|uniref:Cobalt-precorrin 5A hydrolase n=1 Tax=Acetobacter ascendens TaxID=481146 RepID=A0A1Y0V0Z6_9PROT|nr:cobalamin biosynthesis protein [Acetobacter ascendens]ARW11464.1 Cobalt-precorrin 5A hydrolase [Acetobacter ascendens]RCL04752.1 cobalamin biosynthesis protein CbiG [Acetobacter pasteurianus]GCD75141.1 cobalamin(vitamin B12) biosynthesis protein CbiG [Acetobacter pasteurianus NBRC 3299]
MIFLGLGWNSRATLAQAQACIARALAYHSGKELSALAVPAFRHATNLPLQVANCLGIRIVWVELAAMQQMNAHCQTVSARSMQHTGVASVSEACALVAAGPQGKLIVPRCSMNGVTCAVAEGDI